MKETGLPNHHCLKTYRIRECPWKKAQGWSDLGSPVGVTAAVAQGGPAEVTALPRPECQSA